MRSIRRPSRARRSGSPNRVEAGLAALGGLLLAVAFLPGPFGFVAWFAFVPLLAALERMRARQAGAGGAFTLGYVFGLVFFLGAIHWIALLSDVAITVPWLKYPAWIVAAGYLALYPALASWVSIGLARHAGLGLGTVVPFVMLAVEEMRGSGELGFPWFQPGYTQHAYTPVIQMASLGSVTLVTLWLLFVNVLVWRALAGPGRGRAAAGALLVLLLPWLWGARVLDAVPPGEGPAVALIQANVAGEIKWSGKHQDEILDTFVSLSEEAAADTMRPVLLIWPETATGSYLRMVPGQEARVLDLAARTGVPVYSGYPEATRDAVDRIHYFNAAGMFPPGGGRPPFYAKRHLVPFGERMPFQWLFPWIGRLDLGQAEWTPGRDALLFDSDAGPFTTLICFEAIFPDLTREDVRKGARWIVNITNDEWFGHSAALYQHAAMSVFRAVENRVPLARCANTGLTLVADANGRVRAHAPVMRPAVLVARLSPPGRPTLYTRIGDWPGWLTILALGIMAIGRRRPLTARAMRH